MTDSGSVISFRAFLIILIAVVVFSVFTLTDIPSDTMTGFIVRLAFLFLTCFLIIMMHGQDKVTSEAFSVPFILFLSNTIRSFITSDYSDYFYFCLIISCLGALYFIRRELFKFIAFANLIIAIQVAVRIPMFKLELDARVEMTTTEILFNWFNFLIGSVSVYMVTAFAEDKYNNARRAQDSFVGSLLSTPDPMILLDAENRVTYISNSFMKMIHVDRSYYAKGRPVFDLLKDRSLRDLFYDLLSKRESFQTTREIILDGKQCFFEIVVAKLPSESSGYLVNIINITPVMKARFDAEAASRSKSAFLATMSHEIRTPLNAIIGLSEIELQKNLPADTLADLEKIHNSGGNLLAIINDVLDISKIEAGSFELIPVDYDVPSLINDTVQLNIVRKGAKNIVFKLEVERTLPMKLFGDELRVKQILNNLLSNAFKYTREGMVVLVITWEKRNDDAWVMFSVKDTGSGIKEEDIPRLFSEYSQLDARANRHIEGTGLGLSITRNLVSLMNGKIGVESEFGVGTTFTVQLPQRIIDETPIGEETARNLELFRFKDLYRSQSLRLVRSYMPYGKVLVVDDVETNLDVVKGLMLPYGLSIDTASSGPEAIAKIRALANGVDTRYDVIFMDHMMPGMDGIEATRVIREDLGTMYGRTVPIIALTANALTGNEKMFLACGFNDFIPKPIDVMQLDTALNTWVRNKQNGETLKKAELSMPKAAVTDHTIPCMLDTYTVTGIDMIQGRERYNSESAYVNILRSWYLHTPALLEKIKKLSRDNFAEYTITVHGLKGSSYGIFANAIGKEAEDLEGLAKARNFDGVRVRNQAFIAQVEATLSELGTMLAKITGEKGAKPKAAAPDPALFAKLLEAAKRYKSTVMEEILDGIETYEYESGGELVVWLRDQLDNLEYDAICGRLESLDLSDGSR